MTNNYKLPHFNLTPRNLPHQQPKYVQSITFLNNNNNNNGSQSVAPTINLICTKRLTPRCLHNKTTISRIRPPGFKKLKNKRSLIN